jgi:hypothetical protein
MLVLVLTLNFIQTISYMIIVDKQFGKVLSFISKFDHTQNKSCLLIVEVIVCLREYFVPLSF